LRDFRRIAQNLRLAMRRVPELQRLGRSGSQSQPDRMSSTFGATFDAAQILEHILRLCRSRAFTQEVIRSAQGAYLFRYRSRDELVQRYPVMAANSAAAFFTDAGSFNG
jgi:hypothetical protein